MTKVNTFTDPAVSRIARSVRATEDMPTTDSPFGRSEKFITAAPPMFLVKCGEDGLDAATGSWLQDVKKDQSASTLQPVRNSNGDYEYDERNTTYPVRNILPIDRVKDQHGMVVRDGWGSNVFLQIVGYTLAKLNEDLTEGNSAEAAVWWFDESDNVDTGKTITVHDWLLNPNEKISKDRKIVPFLFDNMRWYVVAAQCEDS